MLQLSSESLPRSDEVHATSDMDTSWDKPRCAERMNGRDVASSPQREGPHIRVVTTQTTGPSPSLSSSHMTNGMDSMHAHIGFKVGCMVSIFASCVVGSLLPVQFTRWFADQGKVISFANCLGGGVLLGASYVHLMSDAEDSIVPANAAHFTVAVGFLVSFILERMLFQGYVHGHGHGGHDHVMLVNDLHAHESLNAGDKSHVPLHPHHDHVQHEYRFSHLEAGHHHDHVVHTLHQHKIPYMLFVVLGLESAVTGSALGVQTTFSRTLVTFLAIVTHIWAEAFTLSTLLLKAEVSVSGTVKTMVAFSLITPAAIIVGMGLGQFLAASAVAIVASVLVAFAAGTFVYVASMEIMSEEFANPHNRLTKLALLLLGFIFMSVLGFVL